MNTQKISIQPDQPSANSDQQLSSAVEAEKNSPDSLYRLVAEQGFFKGLNDPHLQVLADSAMRLDFDPGQSIFQEGTPANRFYIILEGDVVLESDVSERGVVVIETLGPGDDLGWSWLCSPYYFHLGARALVPTKTLFFYGTRVREECEQDHELGYQLLKRITEVMIKRLQSTQRRLAQSTGTTRQNAASS
jgi:CRP-like cAMP-binding protein